VWRENIEFCSADGSPMSPIEPGSDPLSGLELEGRFRLRSLLGAGGMGFVYLADHIGLGRDVAVKMLFAERLKDPSIVRRFRREARALAALDHPGCVRVLDVGEIEGTGPYIVMEVVKGEPLDTVLHEHDRLAARHVAHIGAQLADALAAAHAAGIVHRDLKPANVNLDSQDGKLAVRILDFGLALLATGGDDGGSTEARLTRAGMVFGTPEYMAPEQATSTDADARTDIYALGVMLYELATGLVPFRGPTPGAVLAMHSTSPVPPLVVPDISPDLSARFEALVHALLAKKPEARPQSAETVAAQLRLLEADLPDPGPASALLQPSAVVRVGGPATLDDADLDDPRPPRTTGDLEPLRAVSTQDALDARPHTRSEHPFSGLTSSAHADTQLEAALSGAQRRKRARLISFSIVGVAVLALALVFVVRWRAAEAVAAFDRALPSNIPHENGRLLVVEPQAPEGVSPGPPGREALGPADVPGGTSQLAYERARRDLERTLAGRGLRPRDLLAHEALRELWQLQDRLARDRDYDAAATALLRLGEAVDAVDTRTVLEARLRVAERHVGTHGSPVAQASVRALRATLDDAARNGDGARRFLRRVDDVENDGTRETRP